MIINLRFIFSCIMLLEQFGKYLLREKSDHKENQQMYHCTSILLIPWESNTDRLVPTKIIFMVPSKIIV